MVIHALSPFNGTDAGAMSRPTRTDFNEKGHRRSGVAAAVNGIYKGFCVLTAEVRFLADLSRAAGAANTRHAPKKDR